MRIVKRESCVKCGKDISSQNIKKHTIACDGKVKCNENNFTESDGLVICGYCNTVFKSKTACIAHIWRCHTEQGLLHKTKGGKGKGAVKGHIPWNKGLTKETDERVKRNGKSLSDNIKSGKTPNHALGKRHTPETKKRISEIMSLNNKGGRCKWYDVNGISVQGTWERNIAIKLNSYNIKWEKIKTNNHLFSYEMDGKVRSYAPDFYLPEFDVYLEIKGYWWGNDKEKMECIFRKYPDKKIIVLEKELYLKVLDGEQVWLL